MNRSFAEVDAFTSGEGVAAGGGGGWAGTVNLTAGARPLRARSAVCRIYPGALGLNRLFATLLFGVGPTAENVQ